MLSKHFDCLTGIYRRVEVLPQTFEIFIEFGFVPVFLNDQPMNPVDKLLSDDTDFFRPVLPIHPIAALFDKFGVYSVFEFSETDVQLARDFRVFENLCVFIILVISIHEAIMSYADATDCDFSFLFLVEGEFLHFRIELVVV